MTIEDAASPWYVRVMLGVAGCLAAVFLLGFVAVGLAFVLQNHGASIGVGAAMIGGAFALLRVARGDFGAMFAFAISLAGQALLALGIFGAARSGIELPAPWAAMTVVELILVFAMPNFIHRFTAACLAGAMLQLALAASGLHPLAAGVLAAGTLLAMCAGPWLVESIAVPLGYGLAVALIGAESAGYWRLWHLWRDPVRTLAQWPWIGEALVVGVFVAAVGALLVRAGWRLSERRALAALAAAVLVGAASFKAPGLAAGLMIVLLGFAAGRRTMVGLGVVALLFYVSAYYYLLNATLLYKAGVLAAAGVMLLGARWIMLRSVWTREGADA